MKGRHRESIRFQREVALRAVVSVSREGEREIVQKANIGRETYQINDNVLVTLALI